MDAKLRSIAWRNSLMIGIYPFPSVRWHVPRSHSNPWMNSLRAVFVNVMRTICCYIMVLLYVPLSVCCYQEVLYCGNELHKAYDIQLFFCTCHDCHLKNLCNYIFHCVHIKCPGDLFSQPLLNFFGPIKLMAYCHSWPAAMDPIMRFIPWSWHFQYL